MKKMQLGDEPISPNEFDAIQLGLAGPEDILSWSYGEVLNAETINYRTQRPERDGLFDEKIFGPSKDYECYCGKYKGIRYKGVTCDKCGVDVVTSKVRRRRMGHIELATPCSHSWFVKGVSSVMANVLGISSKDLEKIIYFGAFIITEVNKDLVEETLEKIEKEYQSYKSKLSGSEETVDASSSKLLELKSLSEADDSEEAMENLMEAYDKAKEDLENLKKLEVISEVKFHQLSRKYGKIIEVSIGAEAIQQLLSEMDIESEIDKLEKKREDYQEGQEPRKLLRRLNLLRNLDKNNIDPAWMILDYIPVLPPDLRPMVQLDGGRFAASDINDLYRRVINRNSRLKRLQEKGAPEVIQRNEKRMLQEAVDSLIDNKGESQVGRRTLRSLSDLIKGKKGRFRRNLLGKRVDYSGRSVIVIGPELKLNQCGLPKNMAMELFKPFIINRLIKEDYAHNIKNATRMIDRKENVVWDILEEVVDDYPVALNRAPTLHRLGIQTFKPVLVEGKAIRIHPLVCEAYNADFDGDQMAVHVPITKEARKEAREILMSTTNLIKPATGKSVVNPRQDMIYGLYYLTSLKSEGLGEDNTFADKDEAIMMHRNKKLGVRSKIKVHMDGEMVETSVGRIMFNEILPDDFEYMNKLIERGAVGGILDTLIAEYPWGQVVEIADKIKELGFQYSTHSGLTFSVGDVVVPEQKDEIINEAQEKVDEVNQQFQDGLITEAERYSMVINHWTEAKDELDEEMDKAYQKQKDNSIYMMVDSGSRGSDAQLSQLSVMKGLVVNPAGQVIELPITSNYKEGFNSNEYFTSSHGTRKGRTDTALRTAEAGYLTRRLVDVSQELIVKSEDCGSEESIEYSLVREDEMGRDLSQKIQGRNAAQTIKDTSGQPIVEKGDEITQEVVNSLKKSRAKRIKVYSPLTCRQEHGVCAKCYGRDLSTGKLVEAGTAIGIIAAQSIGEPGTQLTMRTFHVGGVAGEDITQGLPRIEEVFEARSPKQPAILAEDNGNVEVEEDKEEDKLIVSVVTDESKTADYRLKKGYEPQVKDGQKVKGGQVVLKRPRGGDIKADFSGSIELDDKQLVIVSDQNVRREYTMPAFTSLAVKEGSRVSEGDQITEGNIDLEQLFKVSGFREAQKYILKELQSIYVSQGQVIHDKHFEVIIRQMFSKVRIQASGDSDLVVGDIEDIVKVKKTNEKLKKNNKKPAKYEELLLGISNVSLNTDSFLSAASFQETTRVLIDAAIAGEVDNLRGLKENVMVGKLIPAGTGFEKNKKQT